MIEMAHSMAAAAVNGRLWGPDGRFVGVSIDTRTLVSGQLFVALRGERHDGHDLLDEARARGAAGAIVQRDYPGALTTIRVSDTRRALGLLAHAWRTRFSLPVVSVTGSNGKTTTKEMIASILRQRGPVLATRGNLNNDIGVPLTLFELADTHRYAVIEMGANRMHDIEDLVGIASPTVALVTMCGPAHLAGFGTLAGVADAKGRIYAQLAADETAVINADDEFADYWRGIARRARIVTFGFATTADFRASGVVSGGLGDGTTFDLHTPDGIVGIHMPLVGRHNVYNALAAAAAASAVGVDLEAVRAGLAAVRDVAGRLNLKQGPHGMRLVDDTYNANPASLSAALAVLGQEAGAKWLLLGDMGELGDVARAAHREAARAARTAGVSRLFGLGPLSADAVAEFGPGAEHFTDVSALVTRLQDAAGPDITLLVKGSRMMQLDKIVAVLARNGDSPC